MDEHEQGQRRHLNKGFGASLNNAFEIALIPVLFAGVGWLIDALLGTGPVFLVILAVLGLAGTVAKLYYGYNREMGEMEQAGPWRRATKDLSCKDLS